MTGQTLSLILCGVFIFLMVLIVIQFTLESRKADQEFVEKMRKIEENLTKSLEN
jgi:succinate dehydrogenase/fumarate reductase cytochrome b subunit